MNTYSVLKLDRQTSGCSKGQNKLILSINPGPQISHKVATLENQKHCSIKTLFDIMSVLKRSVFIQRHTFSIHSYLVEIHFEIGKFSYKKLANIYI